MNEVKFDTEEHMVLSQVPTMSFLRLGGRWYLN